MNFILSVAVISAVCWFTNEAEGHGRLLEPPSRSSLWRFPEFQEYKPEANYLDNQLFCGGVQVQYDQNGGRCGECGDAWQDPRPRENEHNGRYGKGIISRSYTRGQVIDVDIEITAAHKGYFRFSICPLRHTGDQETEECFNDNVLMLADGRGTDYGVYATEQHYYPQIVLPQALTCDHCVFRWHYYTGNGWGECGNGTTAIGCGPQEVFRGCADINIVELK